MYLFKNSCKNVVRNKKKYSLYISVVFLISFISFVSLIMISSSNAVIESKKEEYGSIVMITESDLFFESMSGGDPSSFEMPAAPTETELAEYGISDYVESIISSTTMYMNLSELSLVGEMTEEEQTNVAAGMPTGHTMTSNEGVSVNAKLVSYADEISRDYLMDETITLVDGEVPTGASDILISQQLAELNSLKIGDIVNMAYGDSSVDYTVSGIYYVESSTESTMDTMNVAANVIYTSTLGMDNFITSNNISETDMRMGGSEILYKLNTYNDFDAFETELIEKGLDENYALGYPTDEITSVVTPLESMKDMIFVYISIAFIIGGLLLVFITQLNLKDRRYEIGVLRALNYPKFKLILSFLNEMVIASLMAIALSGIFAVALSQPISNVLLASVNSTQTAEGMPQSSRGNGGGKMVTVGPTGTQANSTTAIEELDITIKLSDIIINTGCIIILVVISSLYGLSFIYRYRPNQILKERS